MAKVKPVPTKDINALIDKGKKQGFITQDDVLAIFPRAEKHLEQPHSAPQPMGKVLAN
mgnify:CR=1 FL=1